jgi:hypothetical protein
VRGSWSSLYISRRDRGIVRLSLLRHEGEPLPQAAFAAGGRAVLDGSSGGKDFIGLATRGLASQEVVYAVSGDDAVYRFSVNGEPDRRIELGVAPTPRSSPLR